jgi:hypothetical protein
MRRAWRDCPRKVYFGFVKGLKPADPSRALTIGSAYHKGLEALRLGADSPVMRGMISYELATAPDLPAYTADQVYAYCAGYIKAFPDGLRTQLSEVAVYDESAEEQGTIDAISVVDDQLWIIEDKTTSRFEDGQLFALSLRLNDQIASYYDGIRKRGFEVEGVRYRQVKKTLTRQNKNETPTEYAERVLDIYTKDANEYREFIVTFDDTEVEMLRENRLKTNEEITKQLSIDDVDQWPYNCNACIGPFGPCEFLTLCITGRDETLKRKAQ